MFQHSLKARLVSTLFIFLALPMAAHAADTSFPDHPIRLIVPWNAGGSNDIAARALQKMVAPQGVNVIVENAPGATGAIGLGRVARSDPDGYTLGMGTSSTLAQIAMKLTNLKNDQFTSIVRVSTDPLILLIPNGKPYKTLNEFLGYMKKNPGKVSIGTPGTHNINHIFAEMTARSAGVGYINVPYTGGSQVMAALAGKQIDAAVLKPSESLGQINAGLVKPVATFSDTRLQVFPDLPTFKELGYNVYPYGPLLQMAYIVGPKGISEPVRQKLISIFSKAIDSQEYKAFADKNGFVVDRLVGDDLQKEVLAVQTTLDTVGSKVFNIK
ncbi:tripartite tricarboxylate transporter substrate binding protein [Paralcaligenes sp. KSB-10]|jgi:tripartite-type tricarboxylate transporter receptor subunit TctC|uniref:Bug family tripartite tricarboxylate transporter substrate binding protein n=1 Tax=Paralcaligenes sp. KSB-10 TaxID=2901142 RepID=UPI001E48E6D0|nr:tripartite tricarboxylate transporter substrate binding protein [Paralcaligenes sp. KSB-10]UHL65223.1 tripartite tricarboxylate transporter substrate binding protein [Paralcaligenes sp. KSB-10]